MYSSAFNSQSNLSGSPDPKTGTFSYVQKFGNISANGGLGPKYDFSMSFSVLGTVSGTNASGLGLGWSFKLGSYSQSSGMLNLNSGEGYKVLFHSQHYPWELSHKVKDFIVEQSNNDIYVKHKAGDIELMTLDAATKAAVLTKYIAADGRYLEFVYRPSSYGYYRLAGIRDSERDLVSVDYQTNNGKVDITIFPNTTEEHLYVLYFTTDQLLREIHMPHGQIIKFEYNSFAFTSYTVLYPIKKITYPTGATEEATYIDQLTLPHGAPIPYLPALTDHTKTVSSTDPAIYSTYTYERIPPYNQPGNNYWGNNTGISWNSNYDNLFDVPYRYEYKSEHRVGGTVTKCNYNKFHQVLTTKETHGSSSHKICSTNTHCSYDDQVLSSQPVQYELTDSEIQNYEESSVSKSSDITKSYTYDDYGNILTIQHPGGISETNEYYPAAGEAGNCPAHPFNLVNFLKTKTLRAADGLTKVYSYTHKSISRVDGSSTFVVPDTLTQGNSVITYGYVDDTTSQFHGKRSSESVTIGGSTTTKAYSYSLGSGTMTITETLTGYDSLVSTSSFTKSIYNQCVLKRVNDQGLVTNNTYNSFGVPLSITTGPGTLYESTSSYEYTSNPTLPTGEQFIGTLVVEKGMSAESHTYFNGENKEAVVYQKDAGSTLRKMSEKSYDNEGKLSMTRDFDYVISDTGTIENTHISELFFTYDHWGNKFETKNNYGIIQQDTYDPITRTRTQRLIRRDDATNPDMITSSLVSVVSTHDDHGKPIQIQTIDSSGTVTGTKTYTHDGFGRTTSITTPSGNTARITGYDDFNRPVKVEHFDGTEFRLSYATHTASSLIASIDVPSVSYTIGQQEYDGLSRVTAKTVNGVRKEYIYKGANKKPSKKLNHRGQTTLFEYIPELATQSSKVATFAADVGVDSWNDPSKVHETLYTYGKCGAGCGNPQGRVLSATSSSGVSYSYQYTAGGMVDSITQIVQSSSGDQTKTFTNVKSTVGGKILVQSDGTKQIKRDYDQYGELISTTDGDNIKVEQTRDDFGRFASKIEKKYNTQSGAFDDIVQTTDVSYDNQGREITRTITAVEKIVTLQNEYDSEDKIVKRTTTIDSSTPGSLTGKHKPTTRRPKINVRASVGRPFGVIDSTDMMVEEYTYDSKRRLTSYDITSYSNERILPQNEHDRPFVSQSFAYDVLDNVTHIITTFPNGNVNTSSFIYDSVDMQRLDRISNTLTSGSNAYPLKVQMGYDADGNVTSMNDTVMTYSVSGRMSSKNGTQYTYDPFDRLVKAGDTIRFFSPNGDVIQEVNNGGGIDFIHHGGVPVGEINNGISKIYGLDQKYSVISVSDDSSTSTTTYSPYGTGNNGARIGLNGELKDEQDNNAYHLGDGIRTYWPGMCTFAGPDNFAPFFGGGINPYAYCHGNPVIGADPSGHKLWLAIFGLVLSVVALVAVPFTAGTSAGLVVGLIGGVAGVISATLQVAAEGLEMSGAATPEQINAIRIASFTFGIISDLAGLGSTAVNVNATRKAGKMASKINRNAIGHYDETRNFITTGYKKRLCFRPSPKEDLRVLTKTDKHGFQSDLVPRMGKMKFGFRFRKQPIQVFNGNKNALSMGKIMRKEGYRIPQMSKDTLGATRSICLKANNISEITWSTSHAGSDENEDPPQESPVLPGDEDNDEVTSEDLVGSERDINDNVGSVHDLPTNGSSDIPGLLGVE